MSTWASSRRPRCLGWIPPIPGPSCGATVAAAGGPKLVCRDICKVTSSQLGLQKCGLVGANTPQLARALLLGLQRINRAA
eukprot:2015543-Pyramimonas_sp.AAC.1